MAKTLGSSSRMACGDLFGAIDGAVVDDDRGDILTIGGGCDGGIIAVVDEPVAEMGLNSG